MQRGFHRTGLLVAILWMLPLIASVYADRGIGANLVGAAPISIIGALVGYALCRLAGWAWAGFSPAEDPTGNVPCNANAATLRPTHDLDACRR